MVERVKNESCIKIRGNFYRWAPLIFRKLWEFLLVGGWLPAGWIRTPTFPSTLSLLARFLLAQVLARPQPGGLRLSYIYRVRQFNHAVARILRHWQIGISAAAETRPHACHHASHAAAKQPAEHAAVGQLACHHIC